MDLKTFSNAEGMELLFNTDKNEEIHAKELPFNEKVEYLRFLLNNDTICNISMLANISMLIRGSNLDESDFAEDGVVFKDLEEYIDIKQELLEDIRQYRDNLTKYFLGALKSLCVVLPDGKVDIPMAYKMILNTLDIMSLSKIVRNASCDIKDAPLVFEPETVIIAIRETDPILEQFCKLVMENIEKTEE